MGRAAGAVGNALPESVQNAARATARVLNTDIGELVRKPSTAGAEISALSGNVGEYTTEINWGIHAIKARPEGRGFWGQRIPQANPRVNAFELKINPNNESYYLPHPNGGYVQFENLVNSTVQDGKLVMNVNSSIYRINDLPPFARQTVLTEATRQVQAASANGLHVEWLVSERQAAAQLGGFFRKEGVKIKVTHFAE